MRANNRQVNLTYDRQKEFLRQQERLKVMACTADKVKSMSADLMIQNLLRDSSHMSLQVEKSDLLNAELPSWLQTESQLLPTEYTYLWSLVQSASNLADTQKVSQLLLTSGLHVDVLGYIWSLVNKTVPGQLTKKEFFIVLALVSLAQRGSSFNNLSVLKEITAPIIPVLKVIYPKKQLPPPKKISSSNIFQSNFNQHFSAFENILKNNYVATKTTPYTNETECKNQSSTAITIANKPTSAFDYNDQKNFTCKIENAETNSGIGSWNLTIPNEYPPFRNKLCKNSNFPCIGSSPTKELEDDFSEFQSVIPDQSGALKELNSAEVSDEFTDFQSANSETLNQLDPFETVVISQKREIPKISLPKSLTVKLTNLKSNILKISPESERKLKVLSPNESLSSLPESKISTTNKVFTTISVLGSNHEIGSGLANHSLSIKQFRNKFDKHHKNKSNPGDSATKSNEEEIIFGVKMKDFESVIPKCCPKKSTFILKETKIKGNEISEAVKRNDGETELNSSAMRSGENTRKIEIPMLGTFSETLLPTQAQTTSQINSATSCIDLIAVEEDKYHALREIKMEINEKNSSLPSMDSEAVNDEFGDFLSADIPSQSFLPLDTFLKESKVSSDLLLGSKDEDNWGEWNFNCETISVSIPVLKSIEGIHCESENEQIQRRTMQNDFDAFNLLSLDDQKSLISINSEGQEPTQNYFFKNHSDVESQVPLDSDMSKTADNDFESGKINIESASSLVSNNQPNNELWGFFASPAEPEIINLSRHNSLPSLNFKMSPCDESHQETIWRKCFESCQNIIQEGVRIFDKIVTKDVLNEVFAAPKTTDYLNNLKIAYEVSKRISQKCNESYSFQEDLDRLWRKLEKLCTKYKLKMNPDLDSVTEGEGNDICIICFGYLGNDFIRQSGQNYHPSCANLWINCIEDTLPCPS